MKKYVCHKHVEAAKIVNIIHDPQDGQFILCFEDGKTYKAPSAYHAKHTPQVGGYFVRYADGYESYSPAKAFEDGYTEEETSA
jgi:hypothetical protein